MKQLLLFVLAFSGWLAAPAFAAGDGAVVVETKSGEKVTFYYEAQPEITFADANVEIKSSEQSVVYAMNDVAQIKFDDTIAGIDDVSKNETRFTFSGTQLIIEGLAPQSKIAVFATDGKMWKEGTADANGKVTMAMGELTRGVYVIKTNKVSYKIVKK